MFHLYFSLLLLVCLRYVCYDRIVIEISLRVENRLSYDCIIQEKEKTAQKTKDFKFGLLFLAPFKLKHAHSRFLIFFFHSHCLVDYIWFDQNVKRVKWIFFSSNINTILFSFRLKTHSPFQLVIELLNIRSFVVWIQFPRSGWFWFSFFFLTCLDEVCNISSALFLLDSLCVQSCTIVVFLVLYHGIPFVFGYARFQILMRFDAINEYR